MSILPFPGPDSDRSKPTVSAIVTAFLADQRSQLPLKTFKQRERYCRLFESTFGARAYDSLRPSEVRAWILGMEVWKPNTRATVSTILKRLFNWAVDDRMIDYNPIKGMQVRGGGPRRPTTEDEFQKMLRAEKGPLRWLLIFMRSTGCRPGEAAALRWEWIDWGNQIAVLPPEFHKTGAKTGKPRLIPLPGMAIKLLRWLERTADKTKHVFLTDRGRQWQSSNMHMHMKSIRAKAGLDSGATLHGIRHLFACAGLAASGDLKSVSRVIGHDRIQTTEAHYLHVGAEEIRNMVKVAELAARRAKHG